MPRRSAGTLLWQEPETGAEPVQWQCGPGTRRKACPASARPRPEMYCPSVVDAHRADDRATLGASDARNIRGARKVRGLGEDRRGRSKKKGKEKLWNRPHRNMRCRSSGYLLTRFAQARTLHLPSCQASMRQMLALFGGAGAIRSVYLDASRCGALRPWPGPRPCAAYCERCLPSHPVPAG